MAAAGWRRRRTTPATRSPMITHETPGDSFWDKIRAGAEQAAKNIGSSCTYSNDPPGRQAGRADPDRGRLQGRRHRHHPGDPGRPGRRGQGAPRTPGSRWSGFNSGIDQYKELGALMYFGSDENLAGADGGPADRRRRRARSRSASSRRPDRWRWRPGAPGVKKSGARRRRTSRSTAPTTPRWCRALQAKLSQDKSIDYIVTLGAPIALDALQAMEQSSSSAKLVTFDLNADAATGDQGRQDPVLDRPAALRAGLHGGGVAVPLHEERQRHRRWPGDADRSRPSSTATNIDKILPFAEKNTR